MILGDVLISLINLEFCKASTYLRMNLLLVLSSCVILGCYGTRKAFDPEHLRKFPNCGKFDKALKDSLDIPPAGSARIAIGATGTKIIPWMVSLILTQKWMVSNHDGTKSLCKQTFLTSLWKRNQVTKTFPFSSQSQESMWRIFDQSHSCLDCWSLHLQDERV